MNGLTRRGALTAVAAGAATSGLATPAIAQSARVLRLVTSWPGGLSGLSDSVNRVADAITRGSNGTLKVDVYPAGKLVPPLAVHDAVGAGDAEMYHSAEYYFQRKHRGLNFFTSVPLGLTIMEQTAWLSRGGGQALWDELNGQFNVKTLPCGGTGTQMGGWFVKPIKSINDFRETVMRIPGLGGQVLNKLGVETVVLPGGGIVAALNSGDIGATEWVGPWNDLQFGFQKLLNTYIYPGFHEPGTMAGLGFNLGVWNSLTAQQRALIETVTQSETLLHSAQYYANNAFALRRLEREYGVRPPRLPDDVFAIIARTSTEVVASVAEDDDLGRRIYESFAAFRSASIRDPAVQAEVAFQKQRALQSQNR
jgi:TRAP-type mannitol/chloroaromatic compound transport system substrate-binding protein